MARPSKAGLDYFPLAVDADSHDKIAILEAKHGALAWNVITKLWMRIYGRYGYYSTWGDNEQYLFARRIGGDKALISAVVVDAVDLGLFSRSMFVEFGVLTSETIQSTYLEACRKRSKVFLREEILLVSIPDFIEPIFEEVSGAETQVIGAETPAEVELEGVSGTFKARKLPLTSRSEGVLGAEMPQSKVKESKVKESKEKNTHGHAIRVWGKVNDRIPIEPSEADHEEEIQVPCTITAKREPFLAFGNDDQPNKVLLTRSELTKLREKFGEKFVSYWISSLLSWWNSKKRAYREYSDHYAVISSNHRRKLEAGVVWDANTGGYVKPHLMGEGNRAA